MKKIPHQIQIGHLLVLCLMAAGLAGFAPQAQAASMTNQFIRNATIGNGFEIMSSRIALQRSQNSEVRDFARRMIDTHRQADEQLRSTIMSSRYRMHGMPNNLDGHHQAMLRQLRHARGPEFDRMYVGMQAQAHDDAVNLYEHYAHDGNNPALRDFARNLLPELHEHQEHVHQLRL